MSETKIILLVEDEALIAIAQKKALEGHGYRVVTAHSGEKALEKVRTTPDIDLILMDINLGKDKMDGTECAEIILKEKDIPVLFLSSYTQPEIVEKTEKITSYGYVVKDSGETVLNTSIKMAFKLYEANRELKETKEAADRYLNVAAALILSLDSRGSITLLNDSGYRLMGYDRGELIGKNWFDTCLPVRLREEGRGIFEKLVQGRGEDVLVYENPVLTKSGEELVILWHNTILRDENGEIVTILSSGEDITSRKRAEAEIALEREKLKALFDTAPFGMTLIDEEGRFTYINQKFTDLFGYDISDVPDGRTWFRKAYPDAEYRHTVISAWKNDHRDAVPGEQRPRTFTVTCKDGSHKIVNFIPLRLHSAVT